MEEVQPPCPQQMAYCAECRRPWQRWVINPQVIRPHRRAPGIKAPHGSPTNECAGSRKLPLPASPEPVTHVVMPDHTLACCHRKPAEIPAFDRLVPLTEATAYSITCPEWAKRHPPSDSEA